MFVSIKEWRKYINKMSAISQKAADEFKAWIDARGGYDNIPRDDLLNFSYELTRKYGEASGALAALMYDDMALLSNANVAPAIAEETLDYGEVAKSIQGGAKVSKDVDYLSSIVGRLVKQVGADTILTNAQRDNAEFAWIPAGDTCMYCLMLASRGWQRTSKDAVKDGHAEHIHSNCNCNYAVRFNEKTDIRGYDPAKLASIYSSADGNTFEDKLNYLRRKVYSRKKDEINEQKRMNYAKQKALEETDKEDIN